MRGVAILNERSPPYFGLNFGTFSMLLLVDRRFMAFCKGVNSSESIPFRVQLVFRAVSPKSLESY